MHIPHFRSIGVAAVAVAVAGGCFALGRLTADSNSARAKGYQSGQSAGYFDGLTAGEAQGRQEGRALQAASTVAANSQQPVQDGFNAGYAAGENDAFGNYDGGWETGSPYVVTVVRGAGGVVNRINTRTLMAPGKNYYLCPNSAKVCTSTRP